MFSLGPEEIEVEREGVVPAGSAAHEADLESFICRDQPLVLHLL